MIKHNLHYAAIRDDGRRPPLQVLSSFTDNRLFRLDGMCLAAYRDMQPKTWIVGVALALACIGGAANAQSNGAWDIVVNGRSHHIDAAYQWNEDNYGLGVEREFATTSRWIKVALGNTFMDSMNNPACARTISMWIWAALRS
jgi:hypothetical protein